MPEQDSPTMTHFVTFAHGRGLGWVPVRMPHGFRTAADVTMLQTQLRREASDETLTITGWQRFETGV